MSVDTRDPYKVVREFEEALCKYTGAPHAVAVDSCTNALFLCMTLRANEAMTVGIPKRTYAGVAQAARNAGYRIIWRDVHWVGRYELQPLDIIDSAKWLYGGMYGDTTGKLVCLSFQAAKTLPIGRGGAILTDNEEDAMRLRMMSFDGRARGVSLMEQASFSSGWHMYMPPPDASRGLWLLSWMKQNNPPQAGEYPDLSEKEWR